MIAELRGGALVGLDQLPEGCPPFDERDSPQILVVQVGKVEGKEQYPMDG